MRTARRCCGNVTALAAKGIGAMCRHRAIRNSLRTQRELAPMPLSGDGSDYCAVMIRTSPDGPGPPREPAGSCCQPFPESAARPHPAGVRDLFDAQLGRVRHRPLASSQPRRAAPPPGHRRRPTAPAPSRRRPAAAPRPPAPPARGSTSRAELPHQLLAAPSRRRPPAAAPPGGSRLQVIARWSRPVSAAGQQRGVRLVLGVRLRDSRCAAPSAPRRSAAAGSSRARSPDAS